LEVGPGKAVRVEANLTDRGKIIWCGLSLWVDYSGLHAWSRTGLLNNICRKTSPQYRKIDRWLSKINEEAKRVKEIKYVGIDRY